MDGVFSRDGGHHFVKEKQMRNKASKVEADEWNLGLGFVRPRVHRGNVYE